MVDAYASADKNITITGSPGSARGNIKSVLNGMPKNVRQRWLMVAAGGVITMSVVAGWLSASNKPLSRVQTGTAATSVDTTPKGLSSQKDWKAQTGADLLLLKQNLAESAAAQKELLARMEAMRQEMSQIKAGPGGGQAAPAPNRIEFSIPPPPEPPKTVMPPAPLPAAASVSPQVAEQPPVKRSAARAFIPVGGADVKADDKARVQEDMMPNERMGYLPAASFVDATLISGVEAFTGGTAQSTPQPLVLRLDENAVLPNAARYQIKGCHVLASVWGDMSSERVFGRLATLTCVDARDKLVLSEEVEGTLVDSDGKNGVRGDLQDRQGAKLARSLLAGFAQGMSSAFGAAQSTVATGLLGTTSSLSGENAIAAAGYRGAGTATQSLAAFYLKQAEATMPIIAIDAGRKVSVLFTKSKPLRFETTGAYRVKPKALLKVEKAVD